MVELGRATAPSAADSQSAETADSGGQSSKRIAGWALVGTGGALLVASAWTGVLALGEKSELDAACQPHGACPESMSDELDSFRTHRTLSYATLALGAVSLGTGGYLLWTTPTGSASAELGFGIGTVRIRGKF